MNRCYLRTFEIVSVYLSACTRVFVTKHQTKLKVPFERCSQICNYRRTHMGVKLLLQSLSSLHLTRKLEKLRPCSSERSLWLSNYYGFFVPCKNIPIIGYLSVFIDKQNSVAIPEKRLRKPYIKLFITFNYCTILSLRSCFGLRYICERVCDISMQFNVLHNQYN